MHRNFPGTTEAVKVTMDEKLIDRHVSDNADTRLSAPTPEPGGPLPGYMVGISAGQATERLAR
jgi:hypothetical protein